MAIRSTALEVAIFNGIDGKCGAQLKLMLFLTGNADNGSFSVPEKTVCERCGMTAETYKKARKALVEKGWIEHSNGKIVVNYDNIYGDNTEKSPQKIETNTEKSPYADIEYSHKRKTSQKYNSKKIWSPVPERDGFVF